MNEKDALKMIQALSDGTRLNIIRFLVGKLPKGAQAGDIATQVSATSSRAAFHLNALENANLVTSQKHSRNVTYTLNSSNMGGLVSYLLNDCCASHPEIVTCCVGQNADRS